MTEAPTRVTLRPLNAKLTLPLSWMDAHLARYVPGMYGHPRAIVKYDVIQEAEGLVIKVLGFECSYIEARKCSRLTSLRPRSIAEISKVNDVFQDSAR
jgi:hypothetical protein